MYKTQVFSSLRGQEKRNIDWSQPLMEFDVAYGIRRDDQIARVIEFFNARQGQLYGFRYKNWCNYCIKNAPIATGDGYAQRLPIWKFYGMPGAQHYKRLTKIVRGTVRGVMLGDEPGQEGVNYTIDYDSGEIVTNTPLPYGVPIYVENLEFDEPVRFGIDDIENVIEAYNNNNLNRLSLQGIRGTYSAGSAFSPNLTETGQRDIHFESVTLLLEFSATDAELGVRDLSLMASPVNLSGTATIDTLAFRHAGGALALGTTGALTVPGDPQDLSTVPFTIETFAQRPMGGERYQPILGRWGVADNQKSYLLRYDFVRDRLQFFVSGDGVEERTILTFPWESSPGYFDHIRVDRMASGWWVLRINGVVRQTARDFAPVYSGTSPFVVGNLTSLPSDHSTFRGNIDSIRITAGSARDEGFATIEVPSVFGRLGSVGLAQNPSMLIPPSTTQY